MADRLRVPAPHALRRHGIRAIRDLGLGDAVAEAGCIDQANRLLSALLETGRIPQFFLDCFRSPVGPDRHPPRPRSSAASRHRGH